MKGRHISIYAVACIVLCLFGCSRTVEDVAKWESKGDTEKLAEALSDPKFEVRKAAAESLGALKAENAVDALAAGLNDDEDSVLLATVDALGAIGTPDTITPLIAAFKLDSMEVRIKAAATLGALKAEAAVEVLAEALDDPDEAIQLVACETLGTIGSTTGSQPLADTLAKETSSLKLKTSCLEALAGTGGDVALKALVESLADDNEHIRNEATTALLKSGRPAIPSVIKGLRNENTVIRSSCIKLLRGLDGTPTRGDGLVWHQLARSSLAESAEAKKEAIDLLVSKGESTVPALIEAASLDVPDIREAAALALENIGEPALEDVMKASEQVVLFETREWFKARSSWIGAPSPLLDLYAAISILNPDFRAPRDPKSILFESDKAPQRAHFPALIKLLAEEAHRDRVMSCLEKAGPSASLPLIAAIASTNTPTAEAAARILADRKDMRAYPLLIDAVKNRVDAGESLSKSPLYSALLKLNQLETEPLLQKVRPNTERALLVFSRQYRNAKIVGIETSDPYTDDEAPVTFHIGYNENNNPGTLEVTFKKDARGNWNPSPALPYALPKPKKEQ